MSNGGIINLSASHERPAQTFSGYAMLLLLLVAIVAPVVVGPRADRRPRAPGRRSPSSGWSSSPIALLFVLCGFYMLQPNQAASITLFGSYRGTDRKTGLRWVWPWEMRAKVSVRSNNFISERIKVNDLRGNPIEMAAQVVWRVVDTAQALFDVDDYKAFVAVQVEAGDPRHRLALSV